MIEALEGRLLLSTATETFNSPSLSGLIARADQGQYTAPAAINQMVSALDSQLTSGPLADLNAGTVDSDGFVAEAQSLERSYEQGVDSQLGGRFPNINAMLKLQGQRVVTELIALNQQSADGLISDTDFASQAQTTIDSLTGGSIRSLNTSASALTSTTQSFESSLTSISQGYADTTLTLDDVNMTVSAEAEAYRTQIHAAIQVLHPYVSRQVDAAINTLEDTVASIAQNNPSDAQTQLTDAFATFDAAVLGTTGVFASGGAYSRAPQNPPVKPGVTNGQVASSFSSVSGTTAADGTATLTATLVSSDGSGISGQSVVFTLDGAFAGVGVTDSSGVATISEVPTTASAGTDTGGVVVYFGGDFYDLPANGVGDLVNSNTADTTLGSVSGSASYGGTATLVATLTDTSTGAALSGQTVNFTLDGTSVGSATTDSSGVATLSGVSTSDTVGTYTGVVVASFAGDTTYNSSTASGDLVVSQAATSVSAVAGSAASGGTGILTATLTSSVTSQGIAGETVTFTLDGVSVGSATTNNSGVATLSGVATSDSVGTHTGAVVATFAGDTNYATSTGTGDLVVATSSSTLTNVSGTATYGGTATLTATLTDPSTSTPLSGQTVTFTLDGTSVGSAQTDSSGVATLSGVATTDSVGTHTGAVVATFAGNSTNAASTASGDLVVTQTGTTLASISGTATYGGTATLTATLTNTSTGAAISGETVTFTLDGVSVGSAQTDSSGVATLSGVATTDDVGTQTGAVVANFAGDTNYSASTGTGDLVVSQAATALSSVAGSASAADSTAILMATLTSSVTGLGIANETIDFTLDGASVGSAVTNSSGVAMLTGVATTDPVGTYSGVVVATFNGDTNYVSSSTAGDLVVAATGTTLSSVSGTATYGDTATLTATLTDSSSNPLSGENVVFTLDGKDVGTAVTDSSGVATLTGVTTTDTAGTHTGAVVATFAGTSSNAASTATGDLVVSQASTGLNSVSGASTYGGTATLTATLVNTSTSQPISGQTVSFTLDGTSVGTAVTDASGVAVLSGVATTDDAGTHTGVVVASYAGDTNYLAASDTSGDLVVSQASTSLSAVSGTAIYGGTATLVATLTDPNTGLPISGQTVDFTLDGVSVGSTTTDSNGVATLTGVATTDGVGTHTGAVVASYAGDTNYLAATDATGDLVVSQATTVLASVSGSATGGTATLTATLTDQVTGDPITGATVDFVLQGTDVGTAVTGSDGVATLDNIATSADPGTYADGVVANYAGDTNYLSSTGSGDFTVTAPA